MHLKVVKTLLMVLVVGVVLTASEALAQTNPSLMREVRRELVRLPYYGVFDWLEYEVQNDGTVILSGEVVRPSTKSDAGGRVKNLDGVRRVQNNIEVLPNSPNDDRLRRALYRSLFGSNSPLFRYGRQTVPPIHLIVKRGHATLKGVVANRADAQIAYMRARGVPGLFSVRNELIIEGERER